MTADVAQIAHVYFDQCPSMGSISSTDSPERGSLAVQRWMQGRRKLCIVAERQGRGRRGIPEAKPHLVADATELGIGVIAGLGVTRGQPLLAARLGLGNDLLQVCTVVTTSQTLYLSHNSAHIQDIDPGRGAPCRESMPWDEKWQPSWHHSDRTRNSWEGGMPPEEGMRAAQIKECLGALQSRAGGRMAEDAYPCGALW